MPDFLEETSKELNATNFNQDLLSIFIRNGFGALPKREIELTLLELLMKHAPNTVGSSPAIYSLARNLRLSPKRLQGLLDEIAYRDEAKTDDWCIAQLKSALQKAEKIQSGGAIQFQIDDGLVRDFAVAQVRAGYGIVDHSFNSAIIKLTGDKFAALAIELMDAGDQKKLMAQIPKPDQTKEQDKQETKSPIRLFVDAFATKAGETAGKKSVDLGFAIITGGFSEAKDVFDKFIGGGED
ncbi:hypothetical protein RB2150_06073 [Rhodobacterales bacterium HTCC2150]|nr:hypothetical protein RB2150_06073 [Rhodobacterales bacterium HTCC2150] [Rhodobacteraceae bacterium HTCC2150]